jgi:uncharacterized membrane protein
MSVLRRVVLAVVFAWFLFGGIGHFVDAAFFAGIVPPYIPFPRAAVAISGALELLGAIGLLFARTRAAAGLGLFALTICVTPANLNMWLHPQQFPQFHPTFLAVRLALQPLLLLGIWWSTRRVGDDAGRRAAADAQ